MYLIDSYGPRYGASAVSASGFSRYIFSAAFPLFAIQSKYTLHSTCSPHLTQLQCMIIWVLHGQPVYLAFFQ